MSLCLLCTDTLLSIAPVCMLLIYDMPGYCQADLCLKHPCREDMLQGDGYRTEQPQRPGVLT
jgi:hypothetical protein